MVVEITGVLDGKTATLAEETIVPLCKEPGSKVILDMTGVSYMSSLGLRLLLLLHRQIASMNGRMALMGLSDGLRDTMSITGFLSHFNTHETLDAAIQSLQMPQSPPSKL